MRLIDADELRGCAIIRPHNHMDFVLINKCSDQVDYDSIPTAYNVDKVVEQLGNEFEQIVAAILDMTGSDYTIADFNLAPFKKRLLEVVKAGGVDDASNI